MDWIEKKLDNVKKFQLENEPELIYVIKTGFSVSDLTTPDFIVVHEDAYQKDLGKTELLSTNQLKEKYNITWMK